jgi:uncharacterized membrane protein
MVLTAVRSLQTMLFAVLMAMAMSPASAHEDHDKQSRQRAEVTSQPSQMTPAAMHEMMEDHAVAMEAAAPKTLDQRVMSWAGRTHPFAVHFPIALFPVALVALILARRRGETVELIRSLIIVAGVASVIAGALGWLTGGFSLAQDDALHFWHRWTGTGLSIAGAILAIWSYRQRSSVFSRTMVVALATITVVLLVQGWLGAALVHGMDHMNF